MALVTKDRNVKSLPWRFETRSAGAVQSDPIEGEFFIGASDYDQDDGHVASLVRESIQNALDARNGDQPVTVHFRLHEAPYEAETLPETDRVRYTISAAARKETLKRLLAENHRRAAAESAVTVSVAISSAAKPTARSKKPSSSSATRSHFTEPE